MPSFVRPARAALVLALVPMLALATLASLGACRSKPAPAADDAGAGAGTPGASEPPKLDDSYGDAASEVLVEAGARFRDAEPKVEADPDGPLDPACTGTEISFAAVVVDKRCAIGSGRAKQLRALLERDAGGAALSLRQEAKVAADGRVVLRLVNTGSASLMLPLSFSAKLPAFTVIAEDDKHSLYELEAPRFELASVSAANDRPHFARIVLPPGGAAVATITVLPAVARVVGRSAAAEKCPDGGAGCAPARLGKGRYVLHVGELLTDVEAGPPARLTWDLP